MVCKLYIYHYLAQHCFSSCTLTISTPQAGFGNWSESERVLSSQRSKKNDGTIATYPDSIIARLVGSRGDGIKKLQDESGADTWYRILWTQVIILG